MLLVQYPSNVHYSEIVEGLAWFKEVRGDTEGKGKRAPLFRQVLLRQKGPPGELRQNLVKQGSLCKDGKSRLFNHRVR